MSDSPPGGFVGLGIEFLDSCAPFAPSAFAIAEKPDPAMPLQPAAAA